MLPDMIIMCLDSFMTTVQSVEIVCLSSSTYLDTCCFGTVRFETMLNLVFCFWCESSILVFVVKRALKLLSLLTLVKDRKYFVYVCACVIFFLNIVP